MSSDKADGPQLKRDKYPIDPPPAPPFKHITPIQLPQYWNKKGTHSVSKAFCTLANEKHKC